MICLLLLFLALLPYTESSGCDRKYDAGPKLQVNKVSLSLPTASRQRDLNALWRDEYIKIFPSEFAIYDRNAPIGWFSWKFSLPLMVNIIQIQLSLGHCHFFISHRIDEQREFTVYKEKGKNKIFSFNSSNLKHLIGRPFIASEVRIHVLQSSFDFYDATTFKNQFAEDAIWASKYQNAHHYVATKYLEKSSDKASGDVVVNFNRETLVSALSFDKRVHPVSFCLKYKLNGKVVPYKDDILSSTAMIFLPTLEIIHLRPFITQSIILSCFDWKFDSSSFVIHFKGVASEEAEHSWKFGAKGDLQISNFVYVYENRKSCLPLFMKIGKKVMYSLRTATDCYNAPHLCDYGFTLKLDVQGSFNGKQNDIYQLPILPYKDESGNIIENQMRIGIFEGHRVFICLQYVNQHHFQNTKYYLNFPYIIASDKRDMNASIYFVSDKNLSCVNKSADDIERDYVAHPKIHAIIKCKKAKRQQLEITHVISPDIHWLIVVPNSSYGGENISISYKEGARLELLGIGKADAEMFTLASFGIRYENGEMSGTGYCVYYSSGFIHALIQTDQKRYNVSHKFDSVSLNSYIIIWDKNVSLKLYHQGVLVGEQRKPADHQSALIYDFQGFSLMKSYHAVDNVAVTFIVNVALLKFDVWKKPLSATEVRRIHEYVEQISYMEGQDPVNGGRLGPICQCLSKACPCETEGEDIQAEFLSRSIRIQKWTHNVLKDQIRFSKSNFSVIPTFETDQQQNMLNVIFDDIYLDFKYTRIRNAFIKLKAESFIKNNNCLNIRFEYLNFKKEYCPNNWNGEHMISIYNVLMKITQFAYESKNDVTHLKFAIDILPVSQTYSFIKLLVVYQVPSAALHTVFSSKNARRIEKLDLNIRKGVKCVKFNIKFIGNGFTYASVRDNIREITRLSAHFLLESWNNVSIPIDSSTKIMIFHMKYVLGDGFIAISNISMLRSNCSLQPPYDVKQPCIGKSECKVCNRFTGRWDFLSNVSPLLHDDCKHDFDRPTVDSYFSMDILNGGDWISDLKNSTERKIKFDSNIMLQKVGIAGKCLCIQSDSGLKIIDHPPSSFNSEYYISLWMNHDCISRVRQLILQTTLFDVYCGTPTLQEEKTMILISFDKCIYYVRAKYRMWYQLSVSIRMSHISIYIDGDIVTFKTDSKVCRSSKRPINRESISVGKSNTYICLDEMLVHSRKKEKDVIEENYQNYLSKPTATIEQIEYSIVPYLLIGVLQELYVPLKNLTEERTRIDIIFMDSELWLSELKNLTNIITELRHIQFVGKPYVLGRSCLMIKIHFYLTYMDNGIMMELIGVKGRMIKRLESQYFAMYNYVSCFNGTEFNVELIKDLNEERSKIKSGIRSKYSNKVNDVFECAMAVKRRKSLYFTLHDGYCYSVQFYSEQSLLKPSVSSSSSYCHHFLKKLGHKVYRIRRKDPSTQCPSSHPKSCDHNGYCCKVKFQTNKKIKCIHPPCHDYNPDSSDSHQQTFMAIKWSSFKEVEINKSYRVIKWIEGPDATLKQPITSIRVVLMSDKGRAVLNFSNPNYMKLDYPAALLDHDICIVPIPLQGAVDLICVEDTVPSPPLIQNCTAQSCNSNNQFIDCSFAEVTNMKNEIYGSYEIFWKLKEELSPLEIDMDANTWNLTTFEKIEIMYRYGSPFYKFSLKTSHIYMSYVIVARTLTQRRYKVGAVNSTYAMSCPGAPTVAPRNINAVVNFEHRLVNVSWMELPKDPSVWRFDDIRNGTYIIYYGYFLLEDGNLNMTSGKNVSNITTTNSVINLNQVTNQSSCIMYFQVAAFSVQPGVPSNMTCIINFAEAPKVAPNITFVGLSNTSGAIISFYTIPHMFCGSHKYLLVIAIPCGNCSQSVSYMNHNRSILRSNETDIKGIKRYEVDVFYDIEIGENISKLKTCPLELINQYLTQQKLCNVTISNLEFYTDYSLFSYFCNEAGCGESSEVIFFTADESVPTCSPPIVFLQNTSSTSVNSTWESLNSNCSNGMITGYNVSLRRVKDDSILYNFTKDRHAEFTMLEEYEYVCVKVSGATRKGFGPYSEEVCTTTDEGIPSSIPWIGHIEWTATSISVTILPTDEDLLKGQLESVIMLYCKMDDNHVLNGISNSNRNYSINHVNVSNFSKEIFMMNHTDFFGSNDSYTLRLGNLSSTFYVFYLVYATKRYTSNRTEMHVVRTQDVPSLPPANVSGEGVDATSIHITWKSIPKAGRNRILKGYRVRYRYMYSNDTLASWSLRYINNTSTFHWMLTDLIHGGQYDISVAGFTKFGTGVESNTIRVSTGHYVDGNYTGWSLWSPCSVSCSSGVRMRFRSCTNPPPFNGGYNCTGPSEDQLICIEQSCAGYKLAPRGERNCTLFCNQLGFICLKRIVTENLKKIFKDLGILCSPNTNSSIWSKDYHPSYDSDGQICAGFVDVPKNVSCGSSLSIPLNTQRICNCRRQDELEFSEWARWSVCSHSCFDTTILPLKFRKRVCNGICKGSTEHIAKCDDVPHCPVDGSWGGWSEISACNQSCGYGHRFRTRKCNNPLPAFNGMDCPGRNVTAFPGCNNFPCPVHGGVSDWTAWSFCEEPCGASNSKRRRYCNSPTPKNRGKFCVEHLQENRNCSLPPCKVIDMNYIVRFTAERWNFRMYKIHGKEAAPVVRRIQENAMVGHQNGKNLNYILVHRLRRGSVIGNFTIQYKKVNRDQIISFVAGMDLFQKMTNMSVGKYDVTSPSVPCLPPSNFTFILIDKTTVEISWKDTSCPFNLSDVYTYIYYKPLELIKDRTKNWEVTGSLSISRRLNVTQLYPGIEYKAYMVQSLFGIGNGPPSKIFSFPTFISAPSNPPSTVTATATSPHEIYLEWKAIPKRFWNGALDGYMIKYKPHFQKYFMVKRISSGYLASTLTSLKPYTDYYIKICGYNKGGEGPTEYSVEKTKEGVPSVLVPDQIVQSKYSSEWWSLSWTEIPPEKVNGKLLGYRLSYHMTSRSDREIGGEIEETVIILDIHTLYYKVTGLPNYATYVVTIAGFTATGDGPSKEMIAETCKCQKDLFANWHVHHPYTSVTKSGAPKGFLTNLVNDLVVTACGSCEHYRRSKLHFNISKSGEDPQKKSAHELKISVSRQVDVSFPLYGRIGRSRYRDNSIFVPLINSPGLAVIVRDEEKIVSDVNNIIISILKIWPFLLVSYLVACMFGLLVLQIDRMRYPWLHLNKNIWQIGYEGFWFSFISMTTVGYGDIVPKSRLARLVAVVWTFIGLVLNSIYSSYVTSALNVYAQAPEIKLADTKTAALFGSFEFIYAIRKHALIDSGSHYTDIGSMLDDLEQRKVDIVLIDSFSTISCKNILKEKFLKMEGIEDTNTAYGVVLSGATVALKNDIESLVLLSKAAVIERFMESMTNKTAKLEAAVSDEKIKKLFDPESAIFQWAVFIIIAWLLVFTICGVVREIVTRMKRRVKVVSEFHTRKEKIARIHKSVEEFSKGFIQKCEKLEETHLKERIRLMDIKRDYQRRVERFGKHFVDEQLRISKAQSQLQSMARNLETFTEF